jgi:hypothetical protein
MADFTHENLSGARFEDVYLTGADFHGVDLTGARFRLVDMTVLEPLWQQTVARARELDPELLHQRVDGEWSFTTRNGSTASTPNATWTPSNAGLADS